MQKLMEKLNKNQEDVQNFLQHYFSEENVTLNKIFLTGRPETSKCLYETTVSSVQNKKNKALTFFLELLDHLNSLQPPPFFYVRREAPENFSSGFP